MEDLIIFGASGFGKKAIPYLEKKYNIVCWLDNSSTKWGEIYENYIVKKPEDVVGYTGNIMVTSVYWTEIEKQLLSLGFDSSQIYSLSIKYTDIGYEYEEYPLNEYFLEPEKKNLLEYDLLSNAERENDKKKVMLFCSFYSVYTKQLIENMAQRYNDLEFSLITSEAKNKDKIFSEQLKHIYVFQTKAELKNILEKIPVYSAMQLLWIEPDWCYFYNLIRKKCKRLNLNVGGSDFYRTNRGVREYKRKLICVADSITAENPKTVKDFQEYYSVDVKGKMGLLPFGIQVLEYIDELRGTDKEYFFNKFHLPKDKIVITCGHNRSRAHQHLPMIRAIQDLPGHIKEQIICVFPMTYPDGEEEYVDEVRKAMEMTGVDYQILTKYMGLREMAMYALVSDIMIYMQETDQLSSTMLEEIYAGGIIVAGSWLPYQCLHEEGIYFLDVETVSDITLLLEDIVEHLEEYKEKCIGNNVLVYKHSSWNMLSEKWHELWI